MLVTYYKRIVFTLLMIIFTNIGCGISKTEMVTAEGENIKGYIGLNGSSYQSFTGKGVTVAIVDSGFQPFDENDKKNILEFKDFVNHKNEEYDDNGHGSFIEGIIAGNKRIHGLAPNVHLVILKVLDQNLQSDEKTLIDSLGWLVKNKMTYGIDIVNISIGIPNNQSDQTVKIQSLIHELRSAGTLIVCSAGNGGPGINSVMLPATFDEVITVGSVRSNLTTSISDDVITNFSGRGASNSNKPDLVTLGVDIRSVNNKGSFLTHSGTSFSAAIVTGALAVLSEKFKERGPDYTEEYIKRSTYDLKIKKWEQGRGELDLK